MMKYIKLAAKEYFKGFWNGTKETMVWFIPFTIVCIILGAILLKKADSNNGD